MNYFILRSATNFAVLLSYATAILRISLKLINLMTGLTSMDEINKWLPWQRCMMDRKTNFRLIVFSRSSTKSKTLAKISPVDVKMLGLTQIVKNK